MIVPVKVVNSGIDSLVIGFNIAEYRRIEKFEILDKAKMKAGEKLFGGKGISVTWFGKEFAIAPKGNKGYEFVLENSDVRICIAKKAEKGRIFPEVYVTFRAEYLWRVGYKIVFYEFGQWLNTWAVVISDTVSRADLCVDIQMDIPKLDLAEDAVTRARGKVNYYEVQCEHYLSGRFDTGYRMGTGALVARIYDKSLEVTITQKDCFQSIWSTHGWDGESKITRVEFQARREFLKEMSVDSFYSLCERSPDMWQYFTAEWLTIRVPSADSHRHRWAIAGWWQWVQDGFNPSGEINSVIRSQQYDYKYERLMQQARGVLVSAMASLCARFGLEHGCLKTMRDIEAMVRSSDFAQDVIKRKARMATMSVPEKNHLVDEVLRLGGNSHRLNRLKIKTISLENVGELALLFTCSP